MPTATVEKTAIDWLPVARPAAWWNPLWGPTPSAKVVRDWGSRGVNGQRLRILYRGRLAFVRAADVEEFLRLTQPSGAA